MSDFAITELQRRLANMIRVGVVSSTDEAARTVRVSFGNITTGALPWPADVGKNYRRWRPLRVGQQVIIASPGGELAQAEIVGMLYGGGIDAPDSSQDLDVIEYEDGTRIQYDSASHQLSADIKGSAIVSTEGALEAVVGTSADIDAAENINATAGGSVDIQAGTSATVAAPTITLDGNVVVTGSLSQGAGGASAEFGGDVNAQGDVKAGDISVQEHVHSGVASGSSLTGQPE